MDVVECLGVRGLNISAKFKPSLVVRLIASRQCFQPFLLKIRFPLETWEKNKQNI